MQGNDGSLDGGFHSRPALPHKADTPNHFNYFTGRKVFADCAYVDIDGVAVPVLSGIHIRREQLFVRHDTTSPLLEEAIDRIPGPAHAVPV